jgi:hypothetical protein
MPKPAAPGITGNAELINGNELVTHARTAAIIGRNFV